MATPRSIHADSAARFATNQRPSCRARDGGIRTVKRVRVPPYPGIRLTRVTRESALRGLAIQSWQLSSLPMDVTVTSFQK
jgi:hypothetical protein